MDFKQLESFVILVECNSFTEAARQLYVSQPTVSSYIHALEEELGVKLIERTTKNMSVTEDGRRLYDYATSILRLRAKACEELNGKGERMIKLGASTIPACYILPQALALYRRSHPQLIFDVWQGDSRQVIDKVSEGNLDLGLVGMQPQSGSCSSEPLCRDELVLATPANDYYRQLQAERAPLARLLQEPLIIRESGSGTQREADGIIEQLGLSGMALNVAAYVNSQQVLDQLLQQGVGVALLSRRAVRQLAALGQALIFELDSENRYRNLYLLYQKKRLMTKQLKHFISFLKTMYAGE
ncbi:MAG: selenium metabolism-associated LysR family transcriptional regulator [Bacillota bacterium]|nr:selenium metabolism-associated LysR family transcriptional regulator [Bacillota bacterium]